MGEPAPTRFVVSSMLRLPRRVGRSLGRPIPATTVAVLAVIVLAGIAESSGRISVAAGAATTTIAPSLIAALGALACWRTAMANDAFARKVWWLFAVGLGMWAAGALPYLIFLAMGGDPFAPAVWSQSGYLLAYPFWYTALWRLRLPPDGQGVRARIDQLVFEVATFVLLAVVVFELLWVRALSVSENAALMIPIVLDLLLVGTLYASIRRSRLAWDSAQTRIGLGIIFLTLADVTTTYFTPRGLVTLAGTAFLIYPIAVGFFGHASAFRLRLSLAQSSLRRSTLNVGAIALALVGPASLLVGEDFVPAILVVGVFLLWRVLETISESGDLDTDTSSGFLQRAPFLQHLSGMLSGSDASRQVFVAVVDLQDFATWTGTHGSTEATRALSDMTSRLEGLTEIGTGTWARLNHDRFAFARVDCPPDEAREHAAAIQRAADGVAIDLNAHAGFALAPKDAVDAERVLEAAEEAMQAGRHASRPVTSFDRGLLDGSEPAQGYAAALGWRRERIANILADPESTWVAYQPIVDLATGETRGYECLSRFNLEPIQGPDKWVAEAHSVGLGVELEAALVARAWVNRSRVSPQHYLGLNVSPALALSPLLDEALGPYRLDQAVIEITEHDAVENYAQLSSRLALLRGRGARIAIDDAGAGHASLRHVSNLQPDLIKLDRSMVENLHLDAHKRAVVRAMLSLAMSKELNAKVVAEGVECEEEVYAARELGVSYAQGYLIGRPAADIPRDDVVEATRARFAVGVELPG